MEDASPRVVEVLSDASSAAGERSCGWCEASLITRRRGTIYCERKCRQSAFRLRRRSHQVATPGTAPGLTFCYADPPYPDTARRYYGKEPDYAGEVDHAALIASLTAAGYAGWALSTSLVQPPPRFFESLQSRVEWFDRGFDLGGYPEFGDVRLGGGAIAVGWGHADKVGW